MISEEETLERILKSVPLMPQVLLPLAEAGGHFLEREVFARYPMPLFDQSAMDGYAVTCPAGASLLSGVKLMVRGVQAAGRRVESLMVEPGTAVRIFTGAPLPAGATAVVMQEDVRVDGGEIELQTEVAEGDFIRRAGEHLCAGQILAGKGERLTPGLLALLSAQGISKVPMSARPRVAILSTGDELICAGSIQNEELQAGQIYESNSVLLAGLLRDMGLEPVVLGIAPDDPAVLREKLRDGLACDALIVTGGVSVGERDFVKQELAALGVVPQVWRVALKPGKPFLFASGGKTAVFGLPGNPVSVFVTFLRFVRPALLKMQGVRDLEMPAYPAVSAVRLENPGERPHYLRGSLHWGKAENGSPRLEFMPVGRQESHNLLGLSRCHALVKLAPNSTVEAGAVVTVLVCS